MRKVLIWAETTQFIGMGHVKRCLVLADQLKAEGFDVEFFTRYDTHSSIYNGYVLWTDKSLKSFLNGKHFDYFIADTYILTQAHLKTIRKYVKHIIVIDDLNNLDLYVADLVINGDYQAKTWKYACSGKVLLGLEYALIGKEFIPNYKVQRDHILVLTGGTNDNLLEDMQKMIYEYYRTNNCKYMQDYLFIFPNLSKYKREEPIHELMQSAALVVTAGGMSMYEALACNTPVLAYTIADNQLPVVKSMSEHGLIAYADKLHKIPEMISNNPALNLFNSKAPKKIVDNLGASRIVNEIKALS